MDTGDSREERSAPPSQNGSLKEAIKRARVIEAERLDASADKRDAEIARLELLRAELEPVFAEIPASDDRFALVLTASRPARLWIDMFAHVAMDTDAAAYELIRNSEAGRRVIFSTPEIAAMRDRVTSYVARQIVVRERQDAGGVSTMPASENNKSARPTRRRAASAFLFGMAIGAIATLAGILAYAWFTLP